MNKNLDTVFNQNFVAEQTLLCKTKISEGTLVVYCDFEPFSLNAAIIDNAEPETLLWHCPQPIWQSHEAVDPENLTVANRIISFNYMVGKNQYKKVFSIDELMKIPKKPFADLLIKFSQNPILTPNPNSPWESISVFNTAAIYLDNKFHFLYRAVGCEWRSVLGYASSSDGIHIDERLPYPVYFSIGPLPEIDDQMQPYPNTSGLNWCGCEDPRLTVIDDTIYMTYTAFDGYHPPCIAMTSIKVKDFLNKKWNWAKPQLLSPPNQKHKNWVFFPEKIHGRYVLLHSISPEIKIQFFDTLDFNSNVHISSNYAPSGRENDWDNWTRGIGPPPIKTDEGWLVLYHAMDHKDPG